jgi:hypothetical protein
MDIKTHLKVFVIAVLTIAFFWFLWRPQWLRHECEQQGDEKYVPSMCLPTQMTECNAMVEKIRIENEAAIKKYVDECLVKNGLK